MSQVITLIVCVTAVWYMLKVRKQVRLGQAIDSLNGREKIYIWATCLLNPVFSGAVFYYGWKKLLPHKARQANTISLWAFFIEVVLGAIIFFAWSNLKQ